MNLVVETDIFRFFVSSNLLSPYKSKLIRLLSLTVEREMGIFCKSFIRVVPFALQKWQRRISVLMLQEQSGFYVSLKQYLNLRSRMWLKASFSLIANGSLLLKISLSTGFMNFNNA